MIAGTFRGTGWGPGPWSLRSGDTIPSGGGPLGLRISCCAGVPLPSGIGLRIPPGPSGSEGPIPSFLGASSTAI